MADTGILISKGSPKTTVEAEHRDAQGNLIAKSVSIQAPSAPNCVKMRCVLKFFLEVLFCGLISIYHTKRVVYAEKKRHKEIPIKYRTGEDAPENIKQAILEIIKLSLRR